MAVKSRASRPEAWRSLLQRGVDTAAELSDVLAEKLNAAADPRSNLMRKRRWALRLGLFFTVACGFWAVVTAVLASWSTPVWVMLITGLIAAGAAVDRARVERVRCHERTACHNQTRGEHRRTEEFFYHDVHSHISCRP